MPKAFVDVTDQQEFSDADFLLKAKADQSKRVAFDLSGITTGTKRIITMPNANFTIGADFTGDSGSGGVHGLVPAPAAGDAAANKFLKASGGWAAIPASGWTHLGTIATTSGSSVSLTSLTLTSYSMLNLVLNGVSLTTGSAFKMNGKTIGTTTANAGAVNGIVLVDLLTGVFAAVSGGSASTTAAALGDASGLSTASTAVTITTGGTFDAGAIEVFAI